jgi:hypothetical protein
MIPSRRARVRTHERHQRDAIGAVAEGLGALGVIVSLAYLASQIRQNTLSNRIAAKQNTTNQFVSFTRDLAQNPELLWVCEHGRSQDEPLDEEILPTLSRGGDSSGHLFAAPVLGALSAAG